MEVNDIKFRHKYLLKDLISSGLTNKLLTIGILPGSEIEFVRKSFFGGSYYLKVDKKIIALRKNEIAELNLSNVSK